MKICLFFAIKFWVIVFKPRVYKLTESEAAILQLNYKGNLPIVREYCHTRLFMKRQGSILIEDKCLTRQNHNHEGQQFVPCRIRKHLHQKSIYRSCMGRVDSGTDIDFIVNK